MTITQNSRSDLGPNVGLIGVPGSRNMLATPCLVLDRRRLERNIASAAAHASKHEIALRPHGKSHKCAAIAKLQIAAGARGICVATVGEAEAMARAGVNDLLITSIFTQPGKIARTVALSKSGCRVMIVADDPGIVDAISAVAVQAGVKFDVLIDVDLGRHRAGVTSSTQALAVAARIAASPSLTLVGLQTYASLISHTASYSERLSQSVASTQMILAIKADLENAGHSITTVTGGSTGTLFIDPGLGCYTELQPGSYVFNDVEYMGVDLDGHHGSLFEPALCVAVSVIGRNVPGRVACDGGNKHFSAKGTLPVFKHPPAPGAVYRPDSDEHGIIDLPAGAVQPELGTTFELIVPHCDPTANLYSVYHIVDGNTLIDIWPIEARGAF
jgi:D-serine deaminase-like pyridoxal phosphate-dependent protein